ncbi:TetR family transcriptional regulator [Pseudonocardia phyllosphaerae]|uniref:TetR family transcriptional regulator n=1 Tax=Pseudonocardia phyllosphaerae TaxID=3390502 RepID=UPI00397900A3
MRPIEDLTARARIRDAAMAEFAERGIRSATIRGIAGRAGVSPALVQHHFGTKDGLRAACDTRAVEYFGAGLEVAPDSPGFFDAVGVSIRPVTRYLARSLVDGSAAAESVFVRLVELTETHLADTPGLTDRRTRAVVWVGMRMGALVLHEQIGRLLATETTDPAQAGTQMARATLDIISPGLLPDGVFDGLRRALDADAPVSVSREQGNQQ